MTHPAEFPLIILYEHPEWQLPLFEALRRRGVRFRALDLKQAAFSTRELPADALYFNQASPSAYVRGNGRAVPFALSYLKWLRSHGREVVNGADAFQLELSKSSQVYLLERLGVDHPRSWVFNHPSALREYGSNLRFPAVLKPDQGGSGARMHRVESLRELQHLLEQNPELWWPDGLMLLQEFLTHDPNRQGIVRLEFLGGELLYAMRVLSGGTFNLCPSEACNPEDSTAGLSCETREEAQGQPRFLPFPDAPPEAVDTGRRIFQAAGLDVGAVEYLETREGRRVFYDINANSNLRRSVGLAFGFDPFERVVDYLQARLQRRRRAVRSVVTS